jgi:hypothetical protein
MDIKNYQVCGSCKNQGLAILKIEERRRYHEEPIPHMFKQVSSLLDTCQRCHHGKFIQDNLDFKPISNPEFFKDSHGSIKFRVEDEDLSIANILDRTPRKKREYRI